MHTSHSRDRCVNTGEGALWGYLQTWQREAPQLVQALGQQAWEGTQDPAAQEALSEVGM